MRRRWPYACFALLLVASLVALWFLPAPARVAITAESFDRITSDMSLDDLRELFGEPYSGTVLNPPDWMMTQCLADPSSEIASRAEWIGDEWGIAVAFDATGRIGERKLWVYAPKLQ